MTSIDSELQQLAALCGIMTSYDDVFQQRHVVSHDSLLAVLSAMGTGVAEYDDVPQVLAQHQLAQHQRGIEPVVIVWQGAALDFDITVPWQNRRDIISCTIELENSDQCVRHQVDLSRQEPLISSCGRFARQAIQIPVHLPLGYHRLRVETGSQEFDSLAIVAPRRAFAPEPIGQRNWGCFLPLYAIRNDRNWGAGDFEDLRQLVAWTTDLGGRLVGTLPLLAAFLDDPCEPSPYAPASRLAWNEFYVDVASIPELTRCPQATDLINSKDLENQISNLRATDHVEYRQIMRLKRQVLELLSESFFQLRPQQRYAEFERFLETHPHMEDYAAFRATQERQSTAWQLWPQRLRNGDLTDGDFDQRNQRYHLYAQWVATTQLESLAEAAQGGLYLDLPLGVRPDGYDTYRWRDAYALQASAGSPPDAMWTQGQNWSFPPLHPERIRLNGYRHVRAYLNHHLRLARILRIDHVMQLHRLFWIPDGRQVAEGTYVQYQAEELYAILNLESHRCETRLIGENLGTVPPAVNQAMRRHGFHRMYVLQYEVASSDDGGAAEQASPRSGNSHEWSTGSGQRQVTSVKLNEVPAASLASLNTHDMPTFAAWWRGSDIELREEIGLISHRSAQQETELLQVQKAALETWLRRRGWLSADDAQDSQILRALLHFLAASDADVVLVNLEDLWLETRPQNVPGTAGPLPNWKRKAAVSLGEFSCRSEIVELFAELNQLRTTTAAEQ
jgi:4-alpha-glucanotransferase